MQKYYYFITSFNNFCFLKGLNVNHTLQVLSMRGNGMGDDGAIYLSEALRDNRVIHELDISFNEIGIIGFKGKFEQNTNLPRHL